MKIPKTLPKVIALLEGPLDRAAVELLATRGAFAFDEDDGVYERIATDLEADDHFSEFKRLFDALPDPPEGIDDAVSDGACATAELAYLLGVAVGRRLGTQPLRAKGAA
jgi:hypothetical protein